MPYAPLPAIAEDLSALRERLLRERQAERVRRLHVLVLFKKDPSHTRQDVAEHLAVHCNTIRRWLARYQRGGLDGLLRIEKRGPKPDQRTVPEPALRALKARLRDGKGFSGYDQIQRWLGEEFGLELSYKEVPYKSVYNLVRYHLRAKLKVPRPEHPKKA